MISSLYIHFPWCVRKCPYCDFESVEKSRVSVDDYIGAAVREMEYQRTQRDIRGPLETIYLGGGTPSLMSPAQVGALIDAAKKYFGVRENPEITIEANPGTVDHGKLVGFKDAGVNRISLGIQSTSDASLRKLGRIHSADDARHSFDLARKVGFDSVSIDVMYGLPDQSLDDWRSDLAKAIDIRPDHLSAYLLKPPAGWVQPDDDVLADMYLDTTELCEKAGLFQYEVSNFAISGKECRHNYVYWHRMEYLGVGPSAHSFFGKIRWFDDSPVDKYFERMKTGSAVAEEETITKPMARDETIMLGLRTREGVDIEAFGAAFGDKSSETLRKAMREYLETGFAFSEGSRIRLTPRGYLIADGIAAEVAAIIDENLNDRDDEKIPD